MPVLETIKVVRKDSKKGYKIINKSDFDPNKHKEYSEAKKPAAKKSAPKKKSTSKK